MRPVRRVPSNFGDHEDQMYLVPSNFCNWLPFFAGHCGNLTVLPRTSLLNLSGEGKKSSEGNGRNMGGAITGDGEGTEEENKRQSPHVRSPPTFSRGYACRGVIDLYARLRTSQPNSVITLVPSARNVPAISAPHSADTTVSAQSSTVAGLHTQHVASSTPGRSAIT